MGNAIERAEVGRPVAARDGAEASLARAAVPQYGAFTRRQAREAGFSRDQILRRLSSRQWILIYPEVMASATTALTRSTKAVAGLLYAGDRAWFSHATAARLLGIDPRLADPRTWVTVPADVQRRRQPGLRIVRSRRTDGFTKVDHDFPVLTEARTVVDLAQVLDEVALGRILYDVVSRGVVTVEEILAAAEDFGGRVGIAMLRDITTEFSPDYESAVEFEADDHFRQAGIHLEPQFEVWDGALLLARLDFADEALRLGFEIDGARFHSSPSARRYDRQRDRALRRRGWQVERFTTEDVRRTPTSMVRDVLAMIEQAKRHQTSAA